MKDNLKEVLDRISLLENDIKALKQELSEMRSETVKPHRIKEIVPTPRKDLPVTTKNEMLLKVDEAVIQSPKQPKREMDFEKALGVWLPRVFMFILLLGVLWGLKVGMDNGWITNPVRVVMGYAGTALLYYLGMRYIRNGKSKFGLTLLGGFIALGILTTFAAHHLYGYINFIVAFVVGVAYIVIGLLLSRKMKSETLTIFSAIAGFLLPFLLEGEGATAIQFCLYVLLLFLSLFYMSLSQQHKHTFYVTFFLFHMTLLAYGTLEELGGNEPILVGTALIQHIVLLYFYLKGSISRRVFSEVLIYTNFVFAIGWIKFLVHEQEIIVFGLFALLYVALAIYLFFKKDVLLQGVLSAVAVFAVSVFILAFNFDNAEIKLIFLLVNGSIGLWVGLQFTTLRTILTSGFLYAVTAIMILGFTYFDRLFSLEHLVWLVLVCTMVWIYYSLYRFAPNFPKWKLVMIDRCLIIGQVMALFYIYKVASIMTMDLWFEVVLHVQLLVIMVVLGIMYLFHKWRHGVYVAHAVVIEFLLLGFFVLVTGLNNSYDNGSFYFNLFVQVLYVLLLTVLFIALMKNKFYVTIKMGIPAMAVLMQVVYFIFLNKWYFSFVNNNDWSWEYILLAHTFLLFAFAFISISMGRKLKWRPVKILGVILIGICILKLFVVDLASISILVRAILFMVVGVVGLLYSRTLLKE